MSDNEKKSGNVAAQKAADHTDVEKKSISPHLSEMLNDITSIAMDMTLKHAMDNQGGAIPMDPQTALFIANIAGLLKKQAQLAEDQANAGQRSIYLPKHQLVVPFNDWAKQKGMVCPAYICEQGFDVHMALFTQNYREMSVLRQDAAKESGNDRDLAFFKLVQAFTTALQDKQNMPRGKAAKTGTKVILTQPAETRYTL